MVQRSTAQRSSNPIRTPDKISIALIVNGVETSLRVAPWTTLLDALRDHLDLTGITIIGHSFGTLVGLIYVINNPGRIKNMVLIAPIPKPNLSVKTSSLYFHIGKILPSPINYRWLTSRLIQDPIRKYVIQTKYPDIHAEIMDEGEQELRELKPKINTQNFLSVNQINAGDWLKKLSTPTLVIAGDKDRLTKPRDVIRTYRRPGIDLKIIPGMGHYAPSEIPDQLEKTIQKWLDTTNT